jgi:SAM-dependent methyltransferase
MGIKVIGISMTNWLLSIMGRDDYESAKSFDTSARSKLLSDSEVDAYGSEGKLTEQLRNEVFQDVTALSIDGVILDYGCGTGHYLKMFEKQKYELIGIDLGKDVLQLRTRHNVPTARLIYGNVYQKSFANEFYNKVDIILLISVIQYIPSSKLKATLCNLTRCLRNKGFLVMRFPTPKNICDIWKRYNYHRYRPIVIEKMLKRNRMKILKSHTAIYHEEFRNFCKYYADYYIVAQKG